MGTVGGINGVAVAGVIVGGVLIYSGVKGFKVTDVVRSFVSNDEPAKNVQSSPVEDSSVGAGVANRTDPDLGSGLGGGGSVGGSANKILGMTLAAPFGWSTGEQWKALDNLWTRESGWNNTAENPSSGAYGIPQALPATKLPKLGQKPVSDPATQILWGLNYIRQRYGDPVGAWAHSQQTGWY